MDGCAWSSKWADHGGQARWGVSHDELFIMWAKQWHYVARAARELLPAILDAARDDADRPLTAYIRACGSAKLTNEIMLLARSELT